jgi:hypothetical protein
MDRTHAQQHLVWVTRAYALNPASIQTVFHGTHGEIEVYVGGSTYKFAEAELTVEGRALLLPPPPPAPGGGPPR